MGKLDQYIEEHSKENSQYNSEIEKGLYKYVIIGSSASIIFILTFYKDAIEGGKFSDFLDIELVLFTISLFAGITGLFLNMLSGERMGKLLNKSLELELERQKLGTVTETNSSEAAEFLQKSQLNISALIRQSKISSLIRNVFLLLGGLIFFLAFVLSIYSVVELS